MARADHSEAQQRRTASNSSSSPRTFNDVACCPAKQAPGRSSVVALKRTAAEGAVGGQDRFGQVVRQRQVLEEQADARRGGLGRAGIFGPDASQRVVYSLDRSGLRNGAPVGCGGHAEAGRHG